MAPGLSPTQRVRALDGLRGAAVVAVLLFHAGHLVGGYLGVDLFFVLSGYLITGLLLTEWDGTGRLRLPAFWARRARRLLPALFLMLVGIAAYSAFVADPTQFDAIRSDGLATLGYVANWHSIIAGHSYWTLFSAPSPLNHTWSLAIEEQFYLVWPLVIVGLALHAHRAQQLPRRVFVGAMAGATGLAALAVGLAVAGTETNRIYLGTDTRAPAILLGAALAAAVAWQGPARSAVARTAIELAGLGGIAWLAWAFMHLSGQDPFLERGGLLLCGVGATAVIASVTHPSQGPISSALSFPPLCWLGLISYGVYLWHWPVYVWLNSERAGTGGWTLTGLRIAVTLTIAVVSYLFVEMPIRRGALRGWKIRVALPAAAAVLIVTLFVVTTGGVNASSTVDITIRHRSGPAVASPLAPRVLVVGDSVGASLGARLDETQRTLGISLFNDAQIACEQIPNSEYHRKPAESDGPPGESLLTTAACRAWPTRWRADLSRVHPDHVLFVVGFPAVSDVKVHGVWHAACSPWWRRQYRSDAIVALHLLASTGARVWVATIARPGANFFPPSLDVQTECVNRLLRDAASAVHASILDIDGYLCPGEGRCGPYLDGESLRPDGLHFGLPGGRILAAWVARQLRLSVAASPMP